VGRAGRAGRADVVKVRTRRGRRLRENLKRAGIWVFLAIFVMSVVGVAVVTVAR
jgi:hypothetical protein